MIHRFGPFSLTVYSPKEDGIVRASLRYDAKELVDVELDVTLRPCVGAQVRFNADDDDTTLSAHTPLGAAYLTFPVCPLDPKEHGYDARTIGWKLRVDEDSALNPVVFHHTLWANVCSHRSDDPWWMRSYVDLTERLLGKWVIQTSPVEKRDVVLLLPEGPCPVHVAIERSVYRRPRSPYTKTYYRATVTPKVPPVVPGKGENSWDCEDDAVHGISTPARTVEEACAAFLARVLSLRSRRAGSWIYPTPTPTNPGSDAAPSEAPRE